jgi:serine protease Do
MAGAYPRSKSRAFRARFLLLLPLLFVSYGLVSAEAPAPADSPTFPPALTKAVPESVDDLRLIQKQVRTVLEKVTPAVVGLQVGKAAGSGVIVSKDGIILTAGHVTGKPDKTAIVIMPDGRRLKAKSLGRNENIDSGMMQIVEKGEYPFVEMGKSADLTRGQWCVTIGHPGGYRPGRTPVVRLGRVLLSNRFLIQTDCTLVGGDSGGPLFDLAGHVIGIHSRIGLHITDNIHVPIDTFSKTWDRLVSGEEWGPFNSSSQIPAYLGVKLEDLDTGCRIDEVTKDSPAQKYGLLAGDFILEFEGKPIHEAEDLAALLSKKKAGDVIALKIRRGSDDKTIKVTLGKNEKKS